MTKVNILKEELPSRGSVADRARQRTAEVVGQHRGEGPQDRLPADLRAVQDQIFDVAGIRIVCSFISDAYAVMDMLTRQPDVEVLRVRDYIAAPKANGYKSLHVVVETPVYMSDRVEHVRVEVQIRTVAMDFWASLEHKIQYQYHRDVPPRLARDLRAAADVAQRLDEHMEQLHNDVVADRPDQGLPRPWTGGSRAPVRPS